MPYIEDQLSPVNGSYSCGCVCVRCASEDSIADAVKTLMP